MPDSMPELRIPAVLRQLMLYAVAACLLAGGLQAETGTAGPRAGLMWNRTGLPAVFPLQVKSPPGADYFLVLKTEAGGEDALAAYIEGGAFFKVLVPPGRFVLRFASGAEWRGEEALFGPDTQYFELPEPLEFAVRGLGGKAGHIVTLRQPRPGRSWLAGLKTQSICQTARLDVPEPGPLDPRPGQGLFGLGGEAKDRGSLHLQWRLGLRYPIRGTAEQQWQRNRFVLGSPLLLRQQPEPVEALPDTVFRAYKVRSQFCG